jgi:UDP-glucose 4-epimerase
MILDNQVILITGGTGSFGSTLCDYLISTKVKEIRIFSRDEKKQDDMRKKISNPKVKFYLGDTRDSDSLEEPIKNVNYIFHAAALKQVPSCEFYPLEAIKTNVYGSSNVMNLASKHNVSKVVMLSTDKAVYPINAMGMTKALMEKCMIAKSRMQNLKETIFCGTRYGNVMGSRGSVIPLFINQIKNKQAITITDPSMTRFLMSLNDSVNLVLKAFDEASGGDIYVQKSPAATIEIIAEALMDIFNAKVPIKIIGTRHGEKLYESLVSREEMSKAEDIGQFYKIPSDNRDLNYGEFFDLGEPRLNDLSDYTSHNTIRLEKESVKKLFLELDFVKRELAC